MTTASSLFRATYSAQVISAFLLRTIFAALFLMSLTCLSACGGGSANNYGNQGGGTEVPVATDLLVVLSAASLPNGGAESITVTVTAVDANRVSVGKVPVVVSADANAVVSVNASVTAESTGKLTATVQTGTDRSNRIVTVTAISGALRRTASFVVTGSKIVPSVLQSVLAPGGVGQIQYRVTDANGNAMSAVPISVAGVGLVGASGQTDQNGSYTFNYVAPSTAGSLNITASTAGVENTQTVLVQSSSGGVPAVSVPITSASVSANPSVVPVNTAGANNRAEIRALFLGIGNQPIKNVRVQFDLAGNANAIDGVLSSGANVVLSDVNGVATTAYIPGERSSPTDGVIVRACYYRTDAEATAGGCPNAATTSLTVISEPLAITIGTDRRIIVNDALTYRQQFVVLVVDASGQAKSGVKVSPSIDLTGYRKGFLGNLQGSWGGAPADGAYISGTCGNEDSNRNGVVEVSEDINKNQKLEPRKSDVAISVVGADVTDAGGRVTLQIEYPRNVGFWVDYKILVSASGVSGTEGRASWAATAGVPADDLSGPGAPAFVVSPYGQGDPLRSVATECSTAD
ncbi:MAG: hypothetical protein RLZZ584_916 [Pseudomonadota bacterium]